MSSTPACSPSGGPAMNTDISGLGVRISFYLQSLFLGLLTVRSTSLDETTNALATLVITNLAMISTSFILGFSNPPEMSFHDALVVFYLLGIAWVTIFLSMPSYNRYVRASKVLKILSILQSYMTFAWTIAVIAKARSFGSNPECNSHAVIVIFGSIKALNTGRFLGLGLVLFVFVIYTVLLVVDYYPLAEEYLGPLKERWRERKAKIAFFQRRKKSQRRSQKRLDKDTEAQKQDQTDSQRKQNNNPKKSMSLQNDHDLSIGSTTIPYTDPHLGGFSGKVLVQVTFIVILVSLAILNTELLIKRNHFAPSGSATWQFGQVLPLFLVVVPCVSVIKAFKENRLELKRHRPRTYSEPLAHSTAAFAPSSHTLIESDIKIRKARTQMSQTPSSSSTNMTGKGVRNSTPFNRHGLSRTSVDPLPNDLGISAKARNSSVDVPPPPPSHTKARTTVFVQEIERDAVAPMLMARISDTSLHLSTAADPKEDVLTVVRQEDNKESGGQKEQSDRDERAARSES